MSTFEYMRQTILESAIPETVILEFKRLPALFRGQAPFRKFVEQSSYATTSPYGDDEEDNRDIFEEFKRWSYLYKAAFTMRGLNPDWATAIAKTAMPAIERVLKAEKRGYYTWLIGHFLLPQIEQVGLEGGRPVWQRRFDYSSKEGRYERESEGWWQSLYRSKPQKIKPKEAVEVALERILQLTDQNWGEFIQPHNGRVFMGGKLNNEMDLTDELAKKYGNAEQVFEVAWELKSNIPSTSSPRSYRYGQGPEEIEAEPAYYHPEGTPRPEEPQEDDFEDDEGDPNEVEDWQSAEDKYDEAFAEWEVAEQEWFDEVHSVTLEEFMEDFIEAAKRSVVREYGSHERFIELEFYDHFNEIREEFEEKLLPHVASIPNFNRTLDIIDHALDVAHRSGKMHQHVGLTDTDYKELGSLEVRRLNTPKDVIKMALDMKVGQDVA